MRRHWVTSVASLPSMEIFRSRYDNYTAIYILEMNFTTINWYLWVLAYLNKWVLNATVQHND